MRTVWKPQDKQIQFMQRPEYEALYGGAAGGGKSEALVMEALRQVHIPHYSGIIFRRTYPQLAELINKSMKYYPAAYPGAKYNATSHVWTFPSGAHVYFGSIPHEQDRNKYQGLAFDFIGFDELTHFGWAEYSYLMSRNRPNGPGTRVYMRATANPGGVGHAWVKERFITAAPPMTPIKGEYEVEQPDGSKLTLKRSRIFVPATVFDNKELLRNDPNYLANLAMMSTDEKNALLYGDWNSFSGQVFSEWVNDPAHYDDQKYTHVVAPFEIPAHWLIYRGFDFGYAKPFSVGWYAVNSKGRIYRIKEYYGCTGEPNVGVKINPYEIAGNIKEIEHNDPMLRGRNIIGIADPSIFDESRGMSVADMMIQPPNFVAWQGGDNTRIAGKMQYHYRFAFDAEGYPMFQVFNTCKHFIRTIPALVYDEKNVEDINTEMEDHIYDECRYVLMANPIAPRQNMPPKPRVDDPLDLYAPKNRSTDFYRL